MKIISGTLIVLFFTCFEFSLNAQTQGGKLMVGGSSRLDSQFGNYKWKSDNSSTNFASSMSFNLSPQIGFFVIDNLAVGLIVQTYYTLYKEKDTKDKTSVFSISGDPFVRYYIGSNKIKPYVNASVGFGSSTNKSMPEGGSTTKTSAGTFNYEGSAGVAMFFNDHVSLDMGIGYTSDSSKNKQNNDNNLKNINSSFGIDFGITIIL